MKIMPVNLACIFIFSFKKIKKSLKLFRIIYKHFFRDTSNWKKISGLVNQLYQFTLFWQKQKIKYNTNEIENEVIVQMYLNKTQI